MSSPGYQASVKKASWCRNERQDCLAGGKRVVREEGKKEHLARIELLRLYGAGGDRGQKSLFLALFQMSSLCDASSVYDGGRASHFATMRHSNRVFSDPAIARFQPATSSTPPSHAMSLSRDELECRSVPVTPMKSMSSNQISRMLPPPPPTNNRFSAPLLG